MYRLVGSFDFIVLFLHAMELYSVEAAAENDNKKEKGVIMVDTSLVRVHGFLSPLW